MGMKGYLVLLSFLVTIKQKSTKLARVEVLSNAEEEVFVELKAATKLKSSLVHTV
jgi:hypothetical protein